MQCAMMINKLPEAVIFDWDGVVIDSSAHHEKSWELLAEEKGLVLPHDHFKTGFGKKNQEIIPRLGWAADPFEIQALGDRKEQIYRDLVREHGILPLPGVHALLEALKKAHIPCSIGSSTPRANIEMIVDIAGLAGLFDAVTCAEDVVHGKPDPEVFLIAAKKVRALPERCVVIEDAFVGIEAAHRAGMRCVAVASTNTLETLQHSDLAVSSLQEVSVKILSGLFD